MNHCVPDFEIQMDDEEEYPNPIPMSSTSALPHPKKPSMANDDVMELLWQNGQVVMQSQNQRPIRKPPPPSNTDNVIPAREIRSVEVENGHNQNLFMQEDEMISWLHCSIDAYPPVDHNFCANLLYSPPTTISGNRNNNSNMQTLVGTSNVAEFQLPSRWLPNRPPIPPIRRPEQVMTKVQKSTLFEKHNARDEPGPSWSARTAAMESTMVDSRDTPMVTATPVADSRASETFRCSVHPKELDTGRGSMSNAGVAAPSTASACEGTVRREKTTFDMTVTSSPGGSSGISEPGSMPAVEDRKRKCRGPEESEFQSEDVDFESAEAKKQVRGSTSTRRSRHAEVHNLSERRRRDRINEKMRALQELIPRCNKADKVSMLDEAIEYLKSLQLQVQMMSMGCGMVPMMFPGIQQYMPPMRMGIGMGMGMEMGMNRPVMPFPNILAGSALPATPAAAHLGPWFPTMPPFHMPHVHPAPDSSRMQAPSQSDNTLTSISTPHPNQSRISNFTDPYQQYVGPH